MKKILYQTTLGKYILGDSKTLIEKGDLDEYKNKVQLILFSPPFPLNANKKYGNKLGEEYKKWLSDLAPLFTKLLKKDGSIVVELGNAWEPKRPVQALLSLEALIAFVKNPKADLRLCQEFICYNPSRLPSPAQWVTINRIRTIDSYTHVWWMSKSDFPKADNRNVLRPYSKSMLQLLKRKSYNSGKRPSEHNISKKGFLKNNHGSIMHNVLELEQMDDQRELRLPENMFSFANTNSNDFFSIQCREKNIPIHPARMPTALPMFFIQFLTDPGDIVFDPFAGSNTTGYCAEKLKRKWLSVEIEKDYGEQAIIRFKEPKLTNKLTIKKI
jgi:site-specific DNA-methyltransferase (cytosine-N4-specific)